VAAQGMTILCAQYGKTVAWTYSPPLTTREAITEFAADGWRAANLWITRDFKDGDQLPEVE